MLYLFIGEDSLSKDAKLKSIRQEFLSSQTEDFNLDVLYAKELNLKAFQERLLSLPVKVKKRIIVVKDAQSLRPDIKEYILSYARKPYTNILLLIDFTSKYVKDEFLDNIARYAKVFRFKESPRLDTFTLSAQIDLRKTEFALRVLNQLLKNGEKPERILGGLRYVCEKNLTSSLEIRKRLKLLLNCDIDIKRGRLVPEFALEKLVVKLCAL